MNKRGISPILSTVFLIIAAVALGLIVMNFGRVFIEEGARCSINTKLKIVKLNEEIQLCYAGNSDKGMIHFIAENGPNTQIEKLHFRVIGEEGVMTKVLSGSNIDIGSSIIQDVSYDFSLYGNIRQVKLSPMILLYPGDDPVLCDEQAVIVEDVIPCR